MTPIREDEDIKFILMASSVLKCFTYENLYLQEINKNSVLFSVKLFTSICKNNIIIPTTHTLEKNYVNIIWKNIEPDNRIIIIKINKYGDNFKIHIENPSQNKILLVERYSYNNENLKQSVDICISLLKRFII